MDVPENKTSLGPLKYGYKEDEGILKSIIIKEPVKPPEFVSSCTCQKCARASVSLCRVQKFIAVHFTGLK